jgi:hypothetical protein
MVALMNLSNRLLKAVRTGPFSLSEQDLARTLWAEVPNNSITLFDRGFLSYMNLLELVADGENRHVLMRLRADTTYEEFEELPDGSVLAMVHPPECLRRQDQDCQVP